MNTRLGTDLFLSIEVGGSLDPIGGSLDPRFLLLGPGPGGREDIFPVASGTAMPTTS